MTNNSHSRRHLKIHRVSNAYRTTPPRLPFDKGEEGWGWSYISYHVNQKNSLPVPWRFSACPNPSATGGMLIAFSRDAEVKDE